MRACSVKTIDRSNMQVGVVASTCILPTFAGKSGTHPAGRGTGSPLVPCSRVCGSAECPEETGYQDGQCNHRRQSQNRDLQDTQCSRCAI